MEKPDLYVAIPASRKRLIPLTLMPSMVSTECCTCGQPVMYHKPCYEAAQARTALVGHQLRTVCQPCSVVINERLVEAGKTVIGVFDCTRDGEINKHFEAAKAAAHN